MKEAARSAEALKREERPRALGATDPGVRGSTLSVVSGLAQCMCAPFWWSVATPEDAVAQILHNGTICYIDTSSRRIGITANHVYKKYLADKEAHDAEAIECQFGSSTIYPERRVIDASERWDIATFDLPDVFVGASIRNRKSYHHAVRWAPHRAQKSDDVMYGGYPGRVVKQQGLTAATAGEHGVILARTDVAQRAGYVDVRNGVCPATLNTKILVDDSAEGFQLLGFK